MNDLIYTLQSEFPGIVGAFVVAFVGLLSVVISLFRRRGSDHSLTSFGLLALTYGLRWLIESETVRTLLESPFDLPYLHALLTYVLPIPLAAFLTQILGPGHFRSMRLVYWSAIVNAVAMVIVDILSGSTSSDGSINVGLVIVWCIVGIYNLSVLKREGTTDLRIVRTGLLVLFLAISHDNLMSIGLFPWSVNLSNAGFMLLCFGLGYVAVRHFLSNERTLLAVEKELEIARRIQRSNLPTDPKLPPGISLAARYRPMTAVAGDFYDVHVVEKRGMGILIADVSGHGVGAALIGSMLKVAFAAQAEQVDDPARVLGEINRILNGKVGDGFVTACAVFFDAKRKRLRYANAGHPAPILRRCSTGTACLLPGGGTILGPFEVLSFENFETSVTRGDRLVLFTDGLVEARNSGGEQYDADRLLAFIQSQDVNTADAAAAGIVEHVLEWAGRTPGDPLDDDLTLVVLDIEAGRS